MPACSEPKDAGFESFRACHRSVPKRLQVEPEPHDEHVSVGVEVEVGRALEAHAVVHAAGDRHDLGGVQHDLFAAEAARAAQALLGERAAES